MFQTFKSGSQGIDKENLFPNVGLVKMSNAV
jgi:hypothetical protein